MKHFIGQVTEDQTAAHQAGDVAIKSVKQPPQGQGNGAGVHHDQPGRKQNHPPVPGAVVGHVAGCEKTVMVAGMPGVEHPRKALFVMTQMSMHPVHAEVEEQQRDRHRQPFQRLDLMHSAPESADGQHPENQHKSAVQPRVVERMNAGAIAAAECLGGLPHCAHLCFL
ncbi:hypothetical protein D3C85_1191650 [compost metagenome]